MLRERRNKAKAFVLTVAILCIFSPTFLNATVTQDNVDGGGPQNLDNVLS